MNLRIDPESFRKALRCIRKLIFPHLLHVYRMSFAGIVKVATKYIRLV